MKNEQLLPRVLEMPYEDLLNKVRNIREARVDAVKASQNKAVKKARPKKPIVDKLVDKMSADEKAKLIALLEAGE